MPTGPNGERRPRDTNACAVTVARIAIGELDEQGNVIEPDQVQEPQTESLRKLKDIPWPR